MLPEVYDWTILKGDIEREQDMKNQGKIVKIISEKATGDS